MLREQDAALSGMQDYTRLVVWQRARALTVAVHEATRRSPDSTAPDLRSQLLRSVISIGANIAEGASRETRADFARFVAIAIGSASEAEYHLTVCSDLGVLDQSVATHLVAQTTEVRQLLFRLRRALAMRVQEREAVFGVIATDPTLLH